MSSVLLLDKKGNKISLSRLSYITGIKEQRLLNILNGKDGVSIRTAVNLRQLCLEYGYDFPVETFLKKSELKVLNYILQQWGITLFPYNPLT
jgi:transcriptional regulator with XRE-family HTH domain